MDTEKLTTVTVVSGSNHPDAKLMATFSIARPAPALDAAKLAKARADSERVAALMGWK